MPNNAYTDQPSAASVPIEISVSIVAPPCRRFAHAARWNGHAPQATTGTVSASDSHCQYVNCSAGTIAIAITGTVSARRDQQPLPKRRRRVLVSGGSTGLGQMRLVAGLLDSRHQLLWRDGVAVLDAGLLGGEVDRRGHPVKLVELLLDSMRTRRARHAVDRELDGGAWLPPYLMCTIPP